jgi:hypothetical protein
VYRGAGEIDLLKEAANRIVDILLVLPHLVPVARGAADGALSQFIPSSQLFTACVHFHKNVLAWLSHQGKKETKV